MLGLKQTKAKGLLAALILGLLFGIALGPCTFAYMAPVLGIVFQTAQTNYLLGSSIFACIWTWTLFSNSWCRNANRKGSEIFKLV